MKLYIYMVLLAGFFMTLALVGGDKIAASTLLIIANLWSITGIIVHQLKNRGDV